MAKKQCLINKLTELQSKHMINPTNTVEQKTEPKAILHEENTFALFQLCRKYSESGDKAGKMLALRLKQQENHQAISSIYNINGALVCDQLNINEAFTDFYSTLYQTECCGSEGEMDRFFKDIELPTLSVQEKDPSSIWDRSIQELFQKAGPYQKSLHMIG